MLATLSDRAPTGGGWVYEPKLDGVRVLAYVTGGSVRLFSRNRKQVEGGYPELVEALALAVRGDAVLDGEIVAPDPATGLSSFARLQQRMHLRDVERAARTGVSVELYLFDCLFYEGIDLTGLPLLDRKKVLRDVVWYDGPIRFTPYRTTGSAAMYREACAKGAEGIIAKRAESRLHQRAVNRLAQDQVRAAAGVRDRWLHRAPGRSRAPRCAAGGLLRRRGTLRYAGKVGTGYDQRHAGDAAPEAGARSTAAPPPSRPGPVPAGDSPVGHAEAGGADRVRRVDRGRTAAASALSRPPGRQGRARGAAGGAEGWRRRGEASRTALSAAVDKRRGAPPSGQRASSRECPGLRAGFRPPGHPGRSRAPGRLRCRSGTRHRHRNPIVEVVLQVEPKRGPAALAQGEPEAQTRRPTEIGAAPVLVEHRWPRVIRAGPAPSRTPPD